MGIFTIVSLVISFFFGVIAISFTLLKEKATIFISGFNTISKEEQEKYDKKKMIIDMRNSFFMWFIILFFGGIFSFYNKYFALIAIIIWIITFFKEVHIDSEKAFKKYKKI
ncbi:DUF3784 domain-containing protein [uncultured Clostridium sp.]|uniref:DUF3784 domain-containing protein n=1 Tax=uncultured Clostridium sp. TaxID=59620 RepID=UPI0026158225|nr:DUF3784 domain-containing protein [uncultured Clostridium sp.]